MYIIDKSFLVELPKSYNGISHLVQLNLLVPIAVISYRDIMAKQAS